jgi:ribosomal protein L37AE/L43A
MLKEKEKKEGVKQEVREALACDNCNSKNVYILKDGTVVCRRCGHRNGKKHKQ